MAEPRIPREDASAALGARRELGDELEPEVVDAFVTQVERAIDARVDARMAQLGPFPASGQPDRSALALAFVSLGTAIPITAIAGAMAGLLGIIIAWIGIVAVNVAYGRRAR